MSGNARDADVSQLDMTPVLMRFTPWHGRQMLHQECKCDEVYKRELLRAPRTYSKEALTAQGG